MLIPDIDCPGLARVHLLAFLPFTGSPMGRCGSKRARHPTKPPSNRLDNLPPPNRSSKRPSKPLSEKKLGPIAIKALLASVEADTEACGLLSVATTPESQHIFFTYLISNHIPATFPKSKLSGDFFQSFMSWAGQLGSVQNPSPRISAALAYRQKQKQITYWSKQNFIETAGLNWKAVDKEAFLSSITVYKEKARPFDDPYPPLDVLMAETKSISNINHKFFYTDKIHDKRDKRRPIKPIKESEIQRDIRYDQSAIIRDADDDSLVGMVIRNVCKNTDAIDFVDKAVDKAVSTRRTCRVSLPLYSSSSSMTQNIFRREMLDSFLRLAYRPVLAAPCASIGSRTSNQRRLQRMSKTSRTRR